MVRNTARPGEKVCILYGGNALYVLRPCGNGEYRFMGGYFVHGLMYGEAMSMGNLKEESIVII